MDVAVFFVLWALLAGGVGALADSRGRSWGGYFLLSLITSPLLGLIVVLVIRDLKVEDQKASERAAQELQQEQRRKQEHEHQLESIRVLAAAPTAAPALHTAIAGVASVADELRKLAQLRAEGILTDEEFGSQKARVLGAQERAPPPVKAQPAKASPATSSDYGICPNCRASIFVTNLACPVCKADFGPNSAWKIERSL